jgi:hypothetical protein
MSPEQRFVMLNVPPRHGKTTYAGIYLPAWYLGLNPAKRVIFSSYGDGTGIRSTYDEHGNETSVEQLTGLPIPEPVPAEITLADLPADPDLIPPDPTRLRSPR